MENSKKSVIPKTFAFRCDWKDVGRNPDGSTYSVSKDDLTKEILRRSRASGDKPSTIKIVVVGFELWELIKKQSTKVYSTMSGTHELDFSPNR